MSHLDRTGEPIDDAPPTHDPRCDGNGWIDPDADTPVPCLDCKPHLAPHRLRRALLDADQRRENP